MSNGKAGETQLTLSCSVRAERRLEPTLHLQKVGCICRVATRLAPQELRDGSAVRVFGSVRQPGVLPQPRLEAHCNAGNVDPSRLTGQFRGSAWPDQGEDARGSRKRCSLTASRGESRSFSPPPWEITTCYVGPLNEATKAFRDGRKSDPIPEASHLTCQERASSRPTRPSLSSQERKPPAAEQDPQRYQNPKDFLLRAHGWPDPPRPRARPAAGRPARGAAAC
jgi:hypothetical protein